MNQPQAATLFDAPAGAAAATWRIDKFAVPHGALDTFLARLRHVQSLLNRQPGCRQNLVLTQTGGPGAFNVVTLVEWASAAEMGYARDIMQKHYAAEGFEPEAFMRELGVRADLALYAATPA